MTHFHVGKLAANLDRQKYPFYRFAAATKTNIPT